MIITSKTKKLLIRVIRNKKNSALSTDNKQNHRLNTLQLITITIIPNYKPIKFALFSKVQLVLSVKISINFCWNILLNLWLLNIYRYEMRNINAYYSIIIFLKSLNILKKNKYRLNIKIQND